MTRKPITIKIQRAVVSNKAFHLICLACGLLSVTFFFSAFLACGFIPPTKPTWTTAHLVGHYKKYHLGMRAGASLMSLSGVFYVPYSALISSQMRRIPGVPYIVHTIQMNAASGGVFTFILPSVILAVAAYRQDRPDQTYILLNDFFWILALMTWPIFMVQNWCFAYAILCDTRERPLIPTYVGIVNFIAPIVFSPGLGVHAVKSGPIAWNGVLTFWLPGVTFGIQVVIDTWSLYRSILTVDEGDEGLLQQHVESSDTSKVAIETLESRV